MSRPEAGGPEEFSLHGRQWRQNCCADRRYSTARFIARVIGQHLQSVHVEPCQPVRCPRHAPVLRRSGEPALWTVSAQGRVVGSLVCQNGSWRLSWFNGADRRLTSYAGPIDGDVEALAESLSARLGAPVRLESQPV